MTGNAWAGRDIEEKRKPRRSQRGQRAVNTTTIISLVYGFGEKFRSPTQSSQIGCNCGKKAKWKEKRVKVGLAAPFYP